MIVGSLGNYVFYLCISILEFKLALSRFTVNVFPNLCISILEFKCSKGSLLYFFYLYLCISILEFKLQC